MSALASASERPGLMLASASVLVAIAATAVLLFDFTEASAPFVRVALFGVVPALCLLAVMVAYARSRPMALTSVVPAVLGLIGIALACTAHQVWYQQLDAPETSAAGALWVTLLATAVGFSGAPIAALLFQALRRSHMSRAAAVALAGVSGLMGGAVFVAALAMPFTSILLSIACFFGIIVRGRSARVRPRQPVG